MNILHHFQPWDMIALAANSEAQINLYNLPLKNIHE